MADQVIDENEDILNEVHDKMDHGPPHDHFISESLQSWILLPCLLIFLLLLGYLIYRLLCKRKTKYQKDKKVKKKSPAKEN